MPPSTPWRLRASALLVGADPFFNSIRDKVVLQVERLRIPAIYEQREFALAGGLPPLFFYRHTYV